MDLLLTLIFSFSSSCQWLLVWQSARPDHVQEWQGLLAPHWAGQSLRHAWGSFPRKHDRLERDNKGWAGLVSSSIRDSTNAARPCGYVHELILVVWRLQIPVSQNNRQWDALLCTRRLKAWRETLGTWHSWEFRLDYFSGKVYIFMYTKTRGFNDLGMGRAAGREIANRMLIEFHNSPSRLF